MGQRFLLVDVEATSATPYSGVMTEFGAVDFETRDWFHGHLWDFHAHPDIPARPIADVENPGVTTSVPGSGRYDLGTLAAVFADLDHWLRVLHPADRHIFVSDNPGFDFMWMADGFDRAGLRNPFGFSSRRIGDLAAGLSGNWKNTSGWKRHRKTTHDHNPVNDALGNAEALDFLLRNHEQKV
jgi:hypothetical protein